MRSVVFDSRGRIRNGWWALAFIAVTVGVGFAQFQLVGLLREAGIPRGGWTRVVPMLAFLGGTWICTRLRREPLASVGLQLDRRFLFDLGLGAALGMGQMLAAVFMIWALGGVTLALDPERSLAVLASGTLMFATVAVTEELLFRGFLFQRLRDGLGTWPALILMASLFALAHWNNPGMEGATRVWATLDIAIGALVLGLAWVRTRSLALPLGLHFGWNWMQGSVLGFAVSGGALRGWLRPTLPGLPEWITGGAFGVEASVFAVVVDTLALAVLLAWKGPVRADPPASGEASALPAAA